jgi:hypothetical protein
MERYRLSIVRSVVVSSLLLGTAPAQALVLAAGSPAQKQRADIAKQVGKEIQCLAKSAIKCEKSGVNAGVECNLSSPSDSTVPDETAKAKFELAVMKCDSKVDLSKKSATGDAVTDYTGIGCPGDSNSSMTGDQPYADLTQFQARIPPGVKTALTTLAIGINCVCGPLSSTDAAVIACVALNASGLLKYGLSAGKCQTKCENDYVDAHGNGGVDDSTTKCALASGSAAPDFQVCEAAARDKATAAGVNSTLIDGGTFCGFPSTGLNSALDAASNDLYNDPNDCTP